MPAFHKATTDDSSITGAINGTNLVFSVGMAYTPGTLAVFLNGQENQNQLTESNPATGQFTLEFAPEVGDTLQAHFFDTTPEATETVLETPLRGRLGLRRLRGAFNGAALEGRLRGSAVQAAVGHARIEGSLRHVAVKGEIGC